MPTVSELVFEQQMQDLREVAASRGWNLSEVNRTRFTITLPAKDGTQMTLLVECDRYPEIPPAFHWYNVDTGALDQAADTPQRGGYFHPSGRICAPWNRLAYKQCDTKGPHGNWELAGWIANRDTGGTTTLAAMVIRIATELRGPNFKGRME